MTAFPQKFSLLIYLLFSFWCKFRFAYAIVWVLVVGGLMWWWWWGGAIMTRLTLMGCRVHLQCISWCQSEAIHVKMKCTEPIKMTSSQPLTYLPFCKLMWGCKFFSGNSAPGLVRNSISIVCLATTQWCTHCLVSVCSLHGSFDGFRLINIKPHETQTGLTTPKTFSWPGAKWLALYS